MMLANSRKNAIFDVDMHDFFLKSLAKLVDEDALITDRELLEAYCHDETPELSSMPDVVVLPKTADEVEKIVALCYEHHVPITPRGAGTGVAGGCIPVDGGLVLSLERMKKICHIDEKNLVVVTQPGVITGELQRTVEQVGLYYPPDPASVDSCSIGGNVATSAGGMRAFKYGTTKKFVNGLEVVFPPGRRARLGGKMIKDVAGYDMVSLMTGSEGTLGIITEITLRLMSKPPVTYDLLAGFGSISDAVNAALSIVPEAGVMPAAMEFMEGEIAYMVEDFLEKKLPFSSCAALLIISVDGNNEEIVEGDFVKVGEHLLSRGAVDVLTATNRVTSENLWQVRKSSREAIRHHSPYIVAEDLAVPPSRVVELMDGMKQIAKKHNVRIVGFGHLGDGNMHIDLLRENMDDAQWKEAKSKIVPEMLSLTVQLDGTISGEHGIGFIKREFLHLGGKNFIIEKMKAIKDAIDPQGLMNPRKIFP